jgi:hypothetical protein
MKFQTMLYAGEVFDENFGWDFGKIILFQSNEHSDITEAMKEFNKTELPEKVWFATMRCIENGEVVVEELFDSSINADNL